jgi:hypothetical protein
MSRYGDRTPKQKVWEAIEDVQFEGQLTWAQVLLLLMGIIADILHYNMDTKEV